MNLNERLEIFKEYCGDWDYRNIDMTLPHIQSIDIVGNNITVEVEMFSTILDDYVSVDGGEFTDSNLVYKFNNLDLDCRNDVWEFMRDIENLVDWKKVDKELSLEIKEEKKIEKFQDINSDLRRRREERCR